MISLIFNFIYCFIWYKTIKLKVESIKVMNDGHIDMLNSRANFYKNLSDSFWFNNLVVERGVKAPLIFL